MQKSLMPTLCILLTIAIAALCYAFFAPLSVPSQDQERAGEGVLESSGKAANDKTVEKTKSRLIRPRIIRNVQSFEEKEKTKARVVRWLLKKALEDDSKDRVLTLASQAANFADQGLREEALEALNWYGSEAIAEMLVFLTDPDDGISRKAFVMVDQALDMVEDEKLKMKLIKSAIDFASTEDEAVSLLAKFESVDAVDAVACISEMSEKVPADSVLGELLAAEYEDITGQKYHSKYSARRWISENRPVARLRNH